LLSPELMVEYIDLRMAQVTGEEKSFRHECCRRQVVNELLDLKAMVIEHSAVESEPDEAQPEVSPV
jgi:hypothetical protein